MACLSSGHVIISNSMTAAQDVTAEHASTQPVTSTRCIMQLPSAYNPLNPSRVAPQSGDGGGHWLNQSTPPNSGEMPASAWPLSGRAPVVTLRKADFAGGIRSWRYSLESVIGWGYINRIPFCFA